MCADWEKAPVELSIVEKKVLSGAPKTKSIVLMLFVFGVFLLKFLNYIE